MEFLVGINQYNLLFIIDELIFDLFPSLNIIEITPTRKFVHEIRPPFCYTAKIGIQLKALFYLQIINLENYSTGFLLIQGYSNSWVILSTDPVQIEVVKEVEWCDLKGQVA